MGRLRNEMMPQMNSTSATLSIRMRLRSAKSMSRRIICPAPKRRRRMQARQRQVHLPPSPLADLLQAVRQTGSLYFEAAERVGGLLAEDPVFILQAHDGGCGHDEMRLLFARAEGGHGGHTGTESAIAIGEHR